MVEPLDVGFCQDCNLGCFDLVLQHLQHSDQDHQVQILHHQDQFTIKGIIFKIKIIKKTFIVHGDQDLNL